MGSFGRDEGPHLLRVVWGLNRRVRVRVRAVAFDHGDDEIDEEVEVEAVPRRE